MALDIETLVERCRRARRQDDPARRIADILGEAIADPSDIVEGVRARQAGMATAPMAELFLNEDDLTIYQVSFPPQLFGVPHDHAGWAVIGVYAGAEAFNTYEETPRGLRCTGRQVMRAPDVQILEPALIHDILNPFAETSGSIHVYSNRHFDLPGRRIWRSEEAAPEPFSVKRSSAYGMELSGRRRAELGLEPPLAPTLPDLPGG